MPVPSAHDSPEEIWASCYVVLRRRLSCDWPPPPSPLTDLDIFVGCLLVLAQTSSAVILLLADGCEESWEQASWSADLITALWSSWFGSGMFLMEGLSVELEQTFWALNGEIARPYPTVASQGRESSYLGSILPLSPGWDMGLRGALWPARRSLMLEWGRVSLGCPIEEVKPSMDLSIRYVFCIYFTQKCWVRINIVHQTSFFLEDTMGNQSNTPSFVGLFFSVPFSCYLGLALYLWASQTRWLLSSIYNSKPV